VNKKSQETPPPRGARLPFSRNGWPPRLGGKKDPLSYYHERAEQLGISSDHVLSCTTKLSWTKMQRLRRNSSRSQQGLLRRMRYFLASEAWGARERSSRTSIHAERRSEGQQHLVLLQAEYLP